MSGNKPPTDDTNATRPDLFSSGELELDTNNLSALAKEILDQVGDDVDSQGMPVGDTGRAIAGRQFSKDYKKPNQFLPSNRWEVFYDGLEYTFKVFKHAFGSNYEVTLTWGGNEPPRGTDRFNDGYAPPATTLSDSLLNKVTDDVSKIMTEQHRLLSDGQAEVEQGWDSTIAMLVRDVGNTIIN